MPNSTERRAETRIEEKTTVFVEVASAEFDNSEPANVIICNSLDLSANGLQLEMDHEVPVGSILRLCAELHDGKQALYLVGEVKWLKKSNGLFQIGFELYDAENTDITGWRQVMSAMLCNNNEEQS